MDINISGNFSEVNKILKELPTKLTTQPLIAGINRTARDARNKGRKAIRATTGIKPRAAKSRVRGATRKAAASRKKMFANIYVRTTKPVPYSQAFNKTEIKKSSSLNRKSFTATMQNGKFSRWQRKGKKRLPIEELRVEVDPIGTRAAQRAIERTVKANLEKEVTRLIKLKLSKIKR